MCMYCISNTKTWKYLHVIEPMRQIKTPITNVDSFYSYSYYREEVLAVVKMNMTFEILCLILIYTAGTTAANMVDNKQIKLNVVLHSTLVIFHSLRIYMNLLPIYISSNQHIVCYDRISTGNCCIEALGFYSNVGRFAELNLNLN